MIVRSQWALLIVAAADGEFLTPMQLQKSVFLISRRLSVEKESLDYVFEGDDYGPVSLDLYRDMGLLRDQGLVFVTQKYFREYAATVKGYRFATELCEQLEERDISYIERVVVWVRSQSCAQLIASICKAFPEYAAACMFNLED